MFPNYSQQVVIATDRRARYEASARNHRLVGRLRRHRSVAADGATSAVALPSIPLGRTPSGIDRRAA